MSRNHPTRIAFQTTGSQRSHATRPRRNSRRSKKTSMFPALVIEGLAVAMIVSLFFSMRADLTRQSRNKILGEEFGLVNQVRELAQQAGPVAAAVQPLMERAQEKWESCWNQIGSAN